MELRLLVTSLVTVATGVTGIDVPPWTYEETINRRKNWREEREELQRWSLGSSTGATALANSLGLYTSAQGRRMSGRGAVALESAASSTPSTTGGQLDRTGPGSLSIDRQRRGLTAMRAVLDQLWLDPGFRDRSNRYSEGLVFSLNLKSEAFDRLATGSRGRSRRRHQQIEKNWVGALASKTKAIGTLERDCVARGGRFDHLVLLQSLPGSSANIPVCLNLRLSVDKLLSVLPHWEPRASTLASTPGPSQVLLATPADAGDVGLRIRLSLASELWAAGIPCEYLHPSPLSTPDLLQFALSHDIPYICLLPRAGAFSSPRCRFLTSQGGSIDEELPLVRAAERIGRFLASATGEGSLGEGETSSQAPSPAEHYYHSDAELRGQGTVHVTSSTGGVEIMIVCASGKKSDKTKEFKLERRVLNQLSTFIAPLSTHVTKVFVMDIPFQVVRQVGSASTHCLCYPSFILHNGHLCSWEQYSYHSSILPIEVQRKRI